MARRRPKGVLEITWAVAESAAWGRTEHVPVTDDYPDHVVRRTTFSAGGDLGWRLSAIESPRAKPAPWKIVVVTGAPSWAEYWAPAIAALPQDREMVVVDRPGYAGSEPVEYVGDIRQQALALSPLLQARPGQKILLVGQSYGAAIATLMAASNPGKVAGLVLLSGYYGQPGPTAEWLLKVGARMLKIIPRDVRHAVLEVTNQPDQLHGMHTALRNLKVPVHVVHGDQDDFAPIELAEKLVAETRTRRPMRFERVAGANHFLNDGPAEDLLATLEGCIPPRWEFRLRWPKWPAGWPKRLGLSKPASLHA
ncbi:alpha/beta fold hydrolase [Phenylobacterium sp.]|uniref:alpha/beta fold hydrolase n=1 Tax=Phenylobacterium sp. TaxID=1871053 RepID=UPI003BA95CCF